MSSGERFRNSVAVLDQHVAECGDHAAKLAWMILRRQLLTPAHELLEEEFAAILPNFGRGTEAEQIAAGRQVIVIDAETA